MQIWRRQKEANSNEKNCKTDRFLGKTLLESIYKSFCNTENRENFNLKAGLQIKNPFY